MEVVKNEEDKKELVTEIPAKTELKKDTNIPVETIQKEKAQKEVPEIKENKEENKLEEKSSHKKKDKKEKKKDKKDQKDKSNEGGKGTAQDKKKKKEERAKEKEAKAKAASKYVKDPNDPSAHLFGDAEVVNSFHPFEKTKQIVYVDLININESLIGKEVRIRARLHSTRGKGKLLFLIIRDRYATAQCILIKDVNNVSPGMIKFADSIPLESVLEIIGRPKKPEKEIEFCSIKLEIEVFQLWVINRSSPILPFNLEVAMQRCENQQEEEEEIKSKEKPEISKESKEIIEEEKGEKKKIRIGQETRLDHRVIDLRVPANHALMKIQSCITRYFREFLYSKDFIEIHSPKIIPGTSEGGTAVFKLDYYGRQACMAQSPQLYKQISILGDMKRVFEIAPVFRAEKSNTMRHFTEFTMLDIEMELKNHYYEALEIFSELFIYIFDMINEKNKPDLEIISQQYPFNPLKYKRPCPILDFKTMVKMLLDEKKIPQDPTEDISSEVEKELGNLVKEKYDTDYYILNNYPKAARPFYTMPNPNDEGYTNSYDFFVRGEEIVSGSQRIHDPDLLAKSATSKGINVDTLSDYISSFKYGAPPHAGCGIGLERILKLFCGIRNIRKCILFTRDPQRLTP